MKRDAYGLRLAQLGVVLVLLAGWQWAASRGMVNPIVASSPTAIWKTLAGWIEDGSLFGQVAATLQVALVGYLLAAVVGTVIGLANGLSPTCSAYFQPFLVFGNSLPRIILIPFFITWLGFGTAPKVASVFLVLVFVIAMNVENGIREIGPDVIAHARVIGASPAGLMRDVYLPGVSLWMLVSARISIGYALQAAIVAEFFGSNRGLGFLIMKGQGSYDVSMVYAALLVTVVLALVLNAALAVVERGTVAWLPSST